MRNTEISGVCVFKLTLNMKKHQFRTVGPLHMNSQIMKSDMWYHLYVYNTALLSQTKSEYRTANYLHCGHLTPACRCLQRTCFGRCGWIFDGWISWWLSISSCVLVCCLRSCSSWICGMGDRGWQGSPHFTTDYTVYLTANFAWTLGRTYVSPYSHSELCA